MAEAGWLALATFVPALAVSLARLRYWVAGLSAFGILFYTMLVGQAHRSCGLPSWAGCRCWHARWRGGRMS